MEKYYGYVAVLLLIIGILYSRPFFLEKIFNDIDHSPKPSIQTSDTGEPAQPQNVAMSNFAEDKRIPAPTTLSLPVFNWPPFNVKNDSGKWVGADVEIVEAVLNRLGYQVDWMEVPFARALEEMKSGKFPAMAPCVIGGGREDYIFFSDPVSSIFSVLWKKRTDNFTWKSYDDLRGRVIGASYYHYGAGFLEAGKNGKFELDMVAAKAPEIIHFRKLLESKTDMFICELSVGLYLQYKYKPEFDEIDYVDQGVGPTRPFSFAVSRKYFEGREQQMHNFVAAFNNELTLFAKEGKRKEIFDKYHMLVGLDDNGMILNRYEK